MVSMEVSVHKCSLKSVMKNLPKFTGKHLSRILLLKKTEAVARGYSVKTVFLEILQNSQELCQSLFFNKVAGLRPATLLKKRLWHRHFPVNFVKFLRTPFFTEHLRWLLLKRGSGTSIFPAHFCKMF